MNGLDKWCSKLCRLGVDGLIGFTLLNRGDDSGQVPLQRWDAGKGLGQFLAESGCEDRPVDGDAGGDADLAEGGVEA